jgi:methylthioribose-1-phosphate isomerase
MRLPFSGRNAKLETMNRILTDAARKRAERIKELEHQVDQLESARKRASELEMVATQRAHLVNEKVEELAAVREVLVQRARRIKEQAKELAGVREVLTQRARSLNEKDEGIAGVREALTKCALRIQEVENALFKIAKE